MEIKKQYSDKEIIAAINIVLSILDEDFALDVREYSDVVPDTTFLRFNLFYDRNVRNREKVEGNVVCDTLAEVLQDVAVFDNIPWQDIFEEDEANYTRLELFFGSDYCRKLLSSINAAEYTDYVETGFGKNVNRLKEYENNWFDKDPLSYLINRDIAQKIIGTESAYVMAEYDGHIYLSAYDTFDNEDDFVSAIKECELPDGEFDNRYDFTIYDSYAEFIDDEVGQVEEDMVDIGLTDEDEWAFYLSFKELVYIGIDKETINQQIEDENCERTTITQATNLPTGWIWKEYSDRSGHLESPDGTQYFSYDWTTGEYKETADKRYNAFLVENYENGGYSIGSFSDFKQYAERWINNNVLKNNLKYYYVSYEKNSTPQLNIVQAYNKEMAEQYIREVGGTIYGVTERENVSGEDLKKGVPIIKLDMQGNEVNNNIAHEEPDICD